MARIVFTFQFVCDGLEFGGLYLWLALAKARRLKARGLARWILPFELVTLVITCYFVDLIQSNIYWAQTSGYLPRCPIIYSTPFWAPVLWYLDMVYLWGSAFLRLTEGIMLDRWGMQRGEEVVDRFDGHIPWWRELLSDPRHSVSVREYIYLFLLHYLCLPAFTPLVLDAVYVEYQAMGFIP